jgi:hypothetical protein
MRIVEPIYPINKIQDDRYKKPVSIRDKKDFKKFLEDAIRDFQLKREQNGDENNEQLRKRSISRLDIYSISVR